MKTAINVLLILTFGLAASTLLLPVTAGFYTLAAALMFLAFATILLCLRLRRGRW